MLITIKSHLLRMIKDKKLIIGVFMAPIVVVFLLFMISNPKNAIKSMKINVVDLNQTSDSQAFISAIKENTEFDFSLVELSNAEENLSNGYISGYLVFNKGFSKSILNNSKLDYDVYVSNGTDITPLINVLQTTALSFVSENSLPLTLSVDKSSATNKYPLSMLLSFIVNFIMFSMIYIVQELYDLKQTKILSRISTAPKTSFELIGSIWISMLVIILVQIATIDILCKMLFGMYLIPKSLSVLVMIVIFSLLVLSIGICISRLVKNGSVIALFANLIILPTGMISGTFMPTSFMPESLSKLGSLTPQYWIYNGIIQAAEAPNLSLLNNILVLGLMATLFFIIGSYKYKNHTIA